MSGLQGMYQQFDSRVHVLSRKMGAERSAKHYFSMLEANGMEIKRLNVEQKEQVKEAWNGHVTKKA